jgi:outer membrane protein OmpA-like peptidoglycan-associated protein
MKTRSILKRRTKDEAEKPFWISFSDLMSALMVLFLLVMCVALLAVTQEVDKEQKKAQDRDNDIKVLVGLLHDQTVVDPDFQDIKVDTVKGVVDFGPRAQFGSKSHKLKPEQEDLLRRYVSKVVLKMLRHPLGQKWVKHIVVEGFADTRGTYLYNLNLSLQRSQRVLCVLLENPKGASFNLIEGDKNTVRDLFLVGGSSFNNAKGGDDENRRIEMRVEFLGLDEKHRVFASGRSDYGSCYVGA